MSEMGDAAGSKKFDGRDWAIRIAIALGAAVVIFVIACLATWHTGAHDYSFGQRRTIHTLRLIRHVIASHVTTHGDLPATLEEVAEIAEHMTGDRDDRRFDDWGHLIQYRRLNDHYEVYSLGRDGMVGGKGLDGDIYRDGRNREGRRPTLKQFFFEMEHTHKIYAPCAVSGLLVGLVCLYAVQKAPRGGKEWAGAIIGIIICAVMAIPIAVFHALTYTSGH